MPQVSASQIRPGEEGSSKIDLTKISPPQIGSLELGPIEIRAAQDGILSVTCSPFNLPEAAPGQVGTAQYRPDQPGAIKIRTYETYTAQDCLAEFRFRKVKPGQVGFPEVKPPTVEQGRDRTGADGKIVEILLERPAYGRVVRPAEHVRA